KPPGFLASRSEESAAAIWLSPRHWGHHQPPPMQREDDVSILGNRVQRREDPAFLTGGDRYLENLPLDGALRVVYVRSTMAHARIVAVDTGAAGGAPRGGGAFRGAARGPAPWPPAGEN